MESHDYYARINGKDYPIAWGFSISDELGETLDMGNITLPHVFEIISLKPYDDVIIHDYAPNASPDDGGLPNRPFGKIFTPGEGHFYKHMVVASYTREKVNLDDEAERTDDSGKRYYSHIYNYRIQLKSETAKLETVQLPNRTISQPTSVADGQSDYLSAGFSFGSENIKYTLPYSQSNSSSGKALHIIEKVTEPTGQTPFYEYYVLNAWIGDDNATTADYSSFLKVKRAVSYKEELILPDWSVSAVSTESEHYNKSSIFGIRYYDEWWNKVAHHPVKHWIVRKLSNPPTIGEWKSKSAIVSRIKNYLSGTDYDDIVNATLTVDGETSVRDITSNSQTSTISVTFPDEEASYIIYLYVEPQLVWIEKTETQSTKKVNLYGTTDNSKGTVNPTESDEFLCSWGTESDPLYVSESVELLSRDATSVYEAIRQNVELYSPYVKVKSDSARLLWEYRRAFSIGDDVKALFSSAIAPENQWNCPNLRDLITRLMYVKDCIPVVHDGVICCMNLAKRGVVPFNENKGLFGMENYAMDGNSYCDRLLRTYNDGLSKDNIVKCSDRLGFRNSSSSTLTLESLRLELTHPIYKITKVYMCYYNNMSVTKDGVKSKYKGVVKHDITPLVVLNSQRNLLSEDWASLSYEEPTSVSELAKYKYATIGYDIGSRYITGWGMKYTYPSCLFWSGAKTVIENILEFAMKVSPSGDNSFDIYDMLAEKGGDSYDSTEEKFVTGASNERKALHSSSITETDQDTGDSGVKESAETADSVFSITLEHNSKKDTDMFAGAIGNYTLRLKSLFFIVEYDGYVSASVMASKDFHDGNVVSRDNASSSLSFVESDGANQKEKVNRLGNAIVTQPVRYASISDIEPLAQVWDSEAEEGDAKEHDDEVLYQRKMIFERDFVQVSYTFCRNYVLRNYFTSVFAKRRPFALASYEESVERQENKTIQLLLSPDVALYQSSSKIINYSQSKFVPLFMSFWKASEYDRKGMLAIKGGADFSYYMVFPSDKMAYAGQFGTFSCDVQKFTSGNSACFSIAMQDSSSAGVFISDYNPTLGNYIGNLLMAKYTLLTDTYRNGWKLTDDEKLASNIVTGSKQSWLMFPLDPETGVLYSMRFGVGIKRNDLYALDSVQELKEIDLVSYQLLPLTDAIVFGSGGKNIYFGEETVTEILGKVVSYSYKGMGYPRIKFLRNSTLYSESLTAYYADFSNKSRKFTYGDVVHSVNESYYEGGLVTFEDADGKSIGKTRQEVDELISAKFVGREDESLDETDTCVFKDGKERMSVTMQIEPISEDNRIQFSDRMMKLSDAIGGCEKNYADHDLKRDIKLMPGISIRNATFLTAGSLYAHFSVFFPVIAFAVPTGAESAVKNIKIGKTISWKHGQYAPTTASSYSIEIQSIKGFDAAGEMIAHCVISCSDFDVVEEDVRFVKVDSSVNYIKGRTGASTLATRWLPFYGVVESGYTAYAMADDGFLIDSNGTKHSMSDESYIRQDGSSACVPDGFLPTKNRNGSLMCAISTGAYPYDFVDVMQLGTDYSYCKVEGMKFDYYDAGSSKYGDVTVTNSRKAAIDAGEISGDASVFKSRNMFWVKAPLMGSRETSWDVRTSLEDSEFDVVDGIMAENEKIIPYTTPVALTCRAKSSSYASTRMSIPQSLVDQDAYEIESVSLELASYELSDNDKLKISSISINDYGNGSFNVIGQGYAVSASAMTASPSVTLNIKVKAKKRIPISVEQDSRGLWRLKIVLEEPLTGERSIRLYYKEGREYHFVFGANLGAKADEGKSADVIYPSDDAGKTYYIYVSVLDDRSKTVIDAVTGDPSYKVVNWLDDAHKDSAPRNACVKKS